MHSLEMLQRMNSASGSAKIRRRAIIINNPGGHPKDAEKGRVITKKFRKAPRRFLTVDEEQQSLTVDDVRHFMTIG